MPNQTSEREIRQKLALKEGIRRQMDRIVEQGARAVTLLGPKGRETSGLQENQIRNVINVAEESGSVLVVTNFIRYQIGRSSRGKEWQYNGFGLRVIEDIEMGVVAETAKKAATVAAEVLGEEADKEALCRQAYPELTRYYLGYLNRAFYFCDKIEAENQDMARRGQMPLVDDPWVMVSRIKEVCQDV